MPLNLRQIEVFRAVMITGTISGAAELLFVSQPAVSRLLAHAEQTVRFMLFERIKGRLYPTPEARQLFLEVENVYLGVQRVNAVVRDLAQNCKGSLRLLSHATIGSALVPQAIGLFHRAHPEVRLTFECVRQFVLKERMLNQRADLGVTIFPLEHPNLESTPLCQASLVCVLPAGHELARHNELRPADLRGQPLINYEQGTPFGLLMGRLFEECGPPAHSSIEAGTPGDACAMVEVGAGVAVVDEFSAREFEGGGVVTRPIAGAPPLQALVVHKRYEPMSKASHAFIALLRELVTHKRPEAPSTAAAQAEFLPLVNLPPCKK